MHKLKKINATSKSGNECISDQGKQIKYSVLDFWRWSVSDLLSNATRGSFAEFIVGSAVGLNPENLREEWDAYDLTTENGIKIEVKSAAYIQSWNQNKYSSISFSVKPTRGWDYDTNQRGEPKRQADLYVFCHLKHKDQNTIDPLKMEQWDFYVLPTCQLNSALKDQSTVSLNSLKKIANAIEYSELGKKITAAHKEQMNHK
ncbi:hypothetical protein R3X25_09005 [Lutibacter sp. TH_r2]|uniref:hypothetical protein n=1 Tax=Lutibacter sp. TH_r2 TaxID=3082083 RepID=UPI002952E73B|nr:hypothetical protein [Lutibacter sp. TH_r2]MDV7187417.1 hypothetical protein [Lutibacter sp. TH_r2]